MTRSMRLGRARGFTLVEMMVAVAIGLIVLLGCAASFVSMKDTYDAEDQLSELQDDERLAMALLTNTVHEAGYYPTPWNADRTQITATDDTLGGHMGAGQFVVGTAAAGTTPETLSLAYASASGDGLLTCQGGTNTSGATVSIRNVFYVDATTGALGCEVLANGSTTTAPGAAFAPLINKVQSMAVLYGVDANGDGAIDKYLTPADVTAGSLWSAVKSVRVTLQFVNPNAAVQPTQPTITWAQTINLMNN